MVAFLRRPIEIMLATFSFRVAPAESHPAPMSAVAATVDRACSAQVTVAFGVL